MSGSRYSAVGGSLYEQHFTEGSGKVSGEGFAGRKSLFKNQRIRKGAVECFLLDLTQALQIRTCGKSVYAHKIKPVQIPARLGEGLPKVPPQAEQLLAVAHCRKYG